MIFECHSPSIPSETIEINDADNGILVTKFWANLAEESLKRNQPEYPQIDNGKTNR